MNELVNLVVDLSDERFGVEALARAMRDIENGGLRVEREGANDRLCAWIDDRFGGAWSSESFAGANVVASAGDRFAGFATYDPRGLNFAWLRGLGAEPGVGIFGPFGVTPESRGRGLGAQLLVAALASLRERGYARALIPAVGEAALIAYYARHANASVAERFPRNRWLEPKVRTVVLASGGGTNFQAVLDRARDGHLPLEVSALVCNDESAYALERARGSGVRVHVIPWKRAEESRSAYDARLLRCVQEEAPQLVLLLGWMHVLDAAFVRAHAPINIHPAFLPLDPERDDVVFPDGARSPAFRGAHAVRDALGAGASWVGASAHRVTLDTDRGPVLTRRPLAIEPAEDEPALIARLHPLEHEVLANGVMRWIYERF